MYLKPFFTPAPVKKQVFDDYSTRAVTHETIRDYRVIPTCWDHELKLHSGSRINSPPFNALSCARMPQSVIFADWTAFG